MEEEITLTAVQPSAAHGDPNSEEEEVKKSDG